MKFLVVAVILLATAGISPAQSLTRQADHDLAVAQEANRVRVVAAYPTIADKTSPLGSAAVAVVKEWQADPNQSAKLLRPDAPQIILAEALLRTPSKAASQATPRLTHDQAVAASSARVYAQYPELTTSGNEFYNYFVRVKTATQQQFPGYFSADDWPERMADECAKRWRDIQAQAAQQSAQISAPVPDQNATASGRTGYPVQRNGQPLPANWIDPDAADAQWQNQQLQEQIAAARQAAQQARDQAERARRAAEDASRR